jgi:isoleucyl-tRNA synthetase
VREGWFVAADGDLSVEIDTELDDALLLEGRVYDVIHHVNSLRKDTGLELTDRITLRLPEEDVDLLPHAARIADETLALDVLFEGDTVTIEKSTSGAR